MSISLLFILLACTGLQALDTENSAEIVRRHAKAFQNAIDAGDKEMVAKLFGTPRTNIDQIISMYQHATVYVKGAVFENQHRIRAIVDFQKGKANVKFMWFLEKEAASPTGWRITLVIFPRQDNWFNTEPIF